MTAAEVTAPSAASVAAAAAVEFKVFLIICFAGKLKSDTEVQKFGN